ncbi:hypothetical protein ACGFWI_38945 [Streptomyces sp. NPDC048434]|uniref:hypothetical protein n=1 Tax=Streptomyces sp. NPDC048434 TaxID=3365549 RepID=UPI003710024B
MSEKAQTFHPGETVPQSGIYECNCGQSHRWDASTNVKNHTFPPLPEDCSGGAWALKDPAHPAT